MEPAALTGVFQFLGAWAPSMLGWTLTFLFLAMVAAYLAFFGLGGIAALLVRMARVVKYPVQSAIGGALLLTLAVSLSDGPAAQNVDSSKLSLLVACDSRSAPHSLFDEAGFRAACQVAAKK
jgi:uncharacterized membrane protein YtjA (UPF0391 family)